MLHKECKFQLKEIGEEGTFTGLAAVYGNVDMGKDMIQPGAFTKTLADKNSEVPILWQHDPREPIGKATLTDGKEGLHIKGELVLESPVAQKAYALLKRGVLKGLSIGYDVVTEKMEKGIRILKEIKLWETSLVTFPMNELALVDHVKGMNDQELAELAEVIAARFEFPAIQKFIKALAEQSSPAATQQLSAPDLHALIDTIRKGAIV